MTDNNIDIEKKRVGRPKKDDRNDKEYYRNFIEKNKEKVKEKVRCPLCGGSYDYFNKSKHIKTKKHQFFLEK